MIEFKKTHKSIKGRYYRLIKALNFVRAYDVLDGDEYTELKKKLDDIHSRWKFEVRAANGFRGRGRPKNPEPEPLKCAKPGCQSIAAHGMRYCSREHAPLGFYGHDSEKRWQSK